MKIHCILNQQLKVLERFSIEGMDPLSGFCESKVRTILSNFFFKKSAFRENTTYLSSDSEAQPDRQIVRKVERVIRSFQYQGLLDRKFYKDLDFEAYKSAEFEVRKMSLKALSQSNNQLFALASLAENCISFVSDVMKSMARFGPEHRFVQNMGYPTGMIWAMGSVAELRGGVDDLRTATRVLDREGVSRARTRKVVGKFALMGSLAYLVAKVSGSAMGVLFSTVVSFFSDTCLGIASLIAVAASGYGALRCHRFRARLDSYYKNSDFESDEKRIRCTLLFLKDHILVTPEEFQEGLNLEDVTKAKLLYLKRRTSLASLQQIIMQINPLLRGLNEWKGIDQAIALIEQIRNDNIWKEFLFIGGALASAISLLGVFLGIFTSIGASQFIIMAISSALSLTITLYMLGASFF